MEVAVATATGTIALAVYLYSCATNPANWDYAEAQTVPYILGIFHPTGFPLYTLVGWLFTHVVPFGTVAWRMNALSGVAMAVTVTALYSTARSLGSNRLAAFGASMVFAFGGTIWFKACRSDVHSFNLALGALTICFATWSVGVRDTRLTLAACFSFGCGLATHPTSLWLAPVVATAAVVNLRGFRVIAAGAVVIMLPLLSYAYLPLRSAVIVADGFDPLFGSPFNGRGEIFWNTNDPRTWDGFVREISGSQFDASIHLLAIAEIRSYPHVLAVWQGALNAEFGVVSWLLIGGFLFAATRHRDLRILAFVAASFGAVSFAVAYSAVESDITRYFLPSFFMLCAAAASATAGPRDWRSRAFASLFGCAIIVGAFANCRNHIGALNYRYDPGGSQSIADAETMTPDGAVIVASWIDATSLAYGAYVDHALGRRIVASGWAADFIDVYPAWSRARRIFVYADSEQLEKLAAIPKTWIASDRPASDGTHRVIEIVPVHDRIMLPRSQR